MSDLTHAHRGYVYQDLLAAVEAVDLILGRANRIWCDTRLCGEHDRFDDLTVEWSDGQRTRRQIKHQQVPRELDVNTFARSSRSLLLSEVLRGIKADIAEDPNAGATSSYTVYLRDSDPLDVVLTTVLVAAEPDPGASVGGTSTKRYKFDAQALWAGVERPAAGSRAAGDAWAFLRTPFGATEEETEDSGGLRFSLDELTELCEKLIVEVNAPAMSSDFSNPGQLEELLLGRLRSEVGVGEYPNENRKPQDVAALLVAAAAKARSSHEPLTRSELLRSLSLRQDYGSVSRRSPVVANQEVGRGNAVVALKVAMDAAVAAGGHLVVEAPPGQGKSWVADQLQTALADASWTVAEHYCFLNDSEEERDDRVATERIFGSLMERVASAHPGLATEQRPIFSADERILMSLVSSVVSRTGHPLALIVDGIDHVTRVRGDKPGGLSASQALAAEIAELEPPPGCVIVVFSQPGSHLAPLVAAGATTVTIPPMSQREVEELLGRLGILNDNEQADVSGIDVAPLQALPKRSDGSPQEGEPTEVLSSNGAVTSREFGYERGDVVEPVYQRSGGNPLYATYLAHELMRGDRAALDMSAGSAVEVLATIPPYDGDLEHYYVHLGEQLDDAGQAAADTLTLVEFPLTESELKSIQPGQAHRIPRALRVLEPVLRRSPRGFAIYHESFARFLRRTLDAEPEALAARLDSVISWLNALGLFEDARAFDAMLPLMATGGRYEDVLAVVDRTFAANAVGAGFPPSAILANLAVSVRCAQRLGDWSAVVRSIELMRGVETYEQERMADLDIRFIEVRLRLFGGQHILDTMLRSGLITMPVETGLRLCAELDCAGVIPPWREYLKAWKDRKENEQSHDNQAVEAALLRGNLRLLKAGGVTASVILTRSAASGKEPILDRLRTMRRAWCGEDRTLERCRIIVDIVSDVFDLEVAAALAAEEGVEGAYLLAVAEQLGALGADVSHPPYGCAAEWADKALESGLPSGWLHRAREISGATCAAESLKNTDTDSERDEQQQALLAAVNAALADHSPTNSALFLDSLERCRKWPKSLDMVIGVLNGEGWYQCWLRFCVDLVRAEACASDDFSSAAMRAMARLAEDTRPFAGKPRAVDLYREMDIIWMTVARAVRLLDPDDWMKGVELLLNVGRSVTGTLDGEMGVPLPPDRTLTLALETAPEQHLIFLSEQIRHEIDLSEGRFYGDIAEFHLLDTLVHLRRANVAKEHADREDGNVGARSARTEALDAWSSACSSLLGYGWHKDVTVFELLDSLENLVALDHVRGLERMVGTFDVAYGAWNHSDGRETRHAPVRWWEILAKADPIAHAENSLAHGLASRGERTRWAERRQDLWDAHAQSADPAISILASATLPDAPRSEQYASVVQRFAVDESDPHNEGLRDAILRRAITRGEEALSPSPDNGTTASESVVDALNAIAAGLGIRQIRKPVECLGPGLVQPLAPDDSALTRASSGDEQIGADAEEQISELAESAPSGQSGLADLARAWRRFGDGIGRGNRRDTIVNAYADAMCVRLKGMLEQGLRAEVEGILETLSEINGLYEPQQLLATIGDKLADASDVEAHGASAGTNNGQEPVQSSLLLRDMAAHALALAWTQARGGGGWLAFGGSEHIELLSRATALSPMVASEAVGIAVERQLHGRQTMGITSALIEALSVGALKATCPTQNREASDGQPMPAQEAIDAAFAVWDEAFAVISGRILLGPGQAHGQYYNGHNHAPPEAEPAIEVQDYALVLATFAGLAHPGRKQLRCTVLALEDLARLRPRLFAHGLARSLASMGGTIVPMLLLTMVDKVAAEDPSVLEHSSEQLLYHLTSDFLVVRVLARRLLGRLGMSELPGPVSDLRNFPYTDAELKGGDGRFLAAAEIHRSAPFRLCFAGDQVEGFEDAVLELTAREMDNESFREDWHGAGREMGNHEWPDAILLDQHAAEDALQRVAGAARAHLARLGRPVARSVEWEDGFGESLRITAAPMMFERGLIPRPSLSPAPVKASNSGQTPTPWATGTPERNFSGESSAWPLPVSELGEPYPGWVVLAYCECRRASTSRPNRDRDQRSYIQAGVEVDLAALDESAWEQPLDELSILQWLHPERTTERDGLRIKLAAIANTAGPFGDDYGRLGHGLMLAPSAELVEVLDLSGVSLEAADMVMCDPNGPALAHVVWRSSYRHSDYFLSYPQLEGAALLVRPDLAQLLNERWGDRLTWRSYSEMESD
ncbi:ATP-binding protein [Paenarthrobacter nicotinovorans]|uniref:ATP-binding protein n=1 Tax=Paenarthrobacter nicotinovorans TaxID=29320 RepID=UPI003826F78F